MKLPSNQKIPFILVAHDKNFTEDQVSVLTALLNASDVQVHTFAPENAGPKTFTPLGDLYLPATGLVDPALEKERLTKELAKVEKDLGGRRAANSATRTCSPRLLPRRWRNGVRWKWFWSRSSNPCSRAWEKILLHPDQGFASPSPVIAKLPRYGA